MQMPHTGHPRIIQCGSRSLTPAEKNYATIELECLAVTWAIHKCSYFLKGIQAFEVVTDHQPLLGTFSKHLPAIENLWLVRLREKILDYSFTISWTSGKSNIIADALSRAPAKSIAAYTPLPASWDHSL